MGSHHDTNVEQSMGYTITIGNAKPEFSKDDGELYARWTVDGQALPNAPVFPHDEMTGNGNSRSPSYSVWAEFCRMTGIYELFLEKYEGLMDSHPGCKMLRPEHLLIVQAALTKWQHTATLPPGFEGYPEHDKETGEWVTPDAGKYDATLARLMWLEFWMRWALENCETPAIENT
jgi:hypothetical protein